METEFYDCERIIDTLCKSDVSHWIQYRMMAIDKISGKEEPYLLDFMKWEHLWITDIYPERWANDRLRCKKIMSHEGMEINFRRISNTSVYVFLRDFQNHNEAMVISGSYQANETGQDESRKLLMYRYFFTRLKGSLDFRIVEISKANAFLILHADSTEYDDVLKDEYRRFKEDGHV